MSNFLAILVWMLDSSRLCCPASWNFTAQLSESTSVHSLQRILTVPKS